MGKQYMKSHLDIWTYERRSRSLRVPAKEDTVIVAVELEPWRSSRDILQELGLSQKRVFRELHDHQLHPYH
jgi:hypothetical protein